MPVRAPVIRMTGLSMFNSCEVGIAAYGAADQRRQYRRWEGLCDTATADKLQAPKYNSLQKVLEQAGMWS
jgi:hypothetical protein